MICNDVQKLIDYAIKKELITNDDIYVVRNHLMEALKLTDWEENLSECSDETIDEIKETAKVSQADGFIRKLEDGYDTVVGERGIGLPGGQKQRISLARAIIKKSPILVLDDSLSSVDTKTEEKILKNLEHITSSITTILISHRISTVKKADEIIVIDNGNIVETGNHRSLLKLKGLYYDMNEKQLLEEKISTIK